MNKLGQVMCGSLEKSTGWTVGGGGEWKRFNKFWNLEHTEIVHFCGIIHFAREVVHFGEESVQIASIFYQYDQDLIKIQLIEKFRPKP